MGSESKTGVSQYDPLSFRGPAHVPHRIRLIALLKLSAILLAVVVFLIWSRSGATSLVFPATYVTMSEQILSNEKSGFSWNKMTPAKHLDFHPCEDGMFCARLDVPFDWNETDRKGPRMAIAVIKKPAQVHVTDPRYGGAIILNPGGPGGSGIYLMETTGDRISRIVDSQTPPESFDAKAKYFDLISFDPRGVNNTTPRINCFPNDVELQEWTKLQQWFGSLGPSPETFYSAWEAAKALSGGCSRSLSVAEDGGQGIVSFVNTTPVIRDMVELVERLGELRDKEAARWLSSEVGQSAIRLGSSAFSSGAVTQRTKWRKGQEKLQYWGLSYGTVIGATFAAMYPERVERLIIDGVVDTETYMDGNWIDSSENADDAIGVFYELCHKAGPEKCPLSFAGTSPLELKAAAEAAIEALVHTPYGVEGTQSRGPQLITRKDIMELMRSAAYDPNLFLYLAKGLAEIIHRNGSFLGNFAHSFNHFVIPSGKCASVQSSTDVDCYVPSLQRRDPTTAIVCTDTPKLKNLTQEEFFSNWQVMRNSSYSFGDKFPAVLITCAHWYAEPKWRFSGPFAGQTAHPLLLLGNTYDPVTPLRSAHKVASRFPGSVVVQHDAPGHSTLSSVSNCTEGIVRNYFQTGDLPSPNTVCAVLLDPFGALENKIPDMRAAQYVLGA